MITTNHVKAALKTIWDIASEPILIGMTLVGIGYCAYLWYLNADSVFWAITWFLGAFAFIVISLIIAILAFRFVLDEVPFRFYMNMRKYRSADDDKD